MIGVLTPQHTVLVLANTTPDTEPTPDTECPCCYYRRIVVVISIPLLLLVSSYESLRHFGKLDLTTQGISLLTSTLWAGSLLRTPAPLVVKVASVLSIGLAQFYLGDAFRRNKEHVVFLKGIVEVRDVTLGQHHER